MVVELSRVSSLRVGAGVAVSEEIEILSLKRAIHFFCLDHLILTEKFLQLLL